MTPPEGTSVAVIGGGPAGLAAAEVLAGGGALVQLYDAKPTVARKFLMAGRGGLNITHSEPFDLFASRYGARRAQLQSSLERFDPGALREWVHGLGIETFVGTSGRVFPREMKAAPLLRAWVHRLRASGVRFHLRHRWIGWGDAGRLAFETPEGLQHATAHAAILALGGGSWASLGSDGAWVPVLEGRGIPVAPLLPSNGGFETAWSDRFIAQWAGHPLKTAAFRIEDAAGPALRGECMITRHGVEGGAIYALSAALRDRILGSGKAVLLVDLLPDHEASRVLEEVSRPRGAKSWSTHLRSRLGLTGLRAALLRECLPREAFEDPDALARGIKALPIILQACRPLDEAISTAGGVRFDALTDGLMLRDLPGVFCAGEMLDWEAPTGGYLLQGSIATGRRAALGALDWLSSRRERNRI
ncbi:MAG: TIGR03862 family flavoprotein [Burkholderiales bacterium]